MASQVEVSMKRMLVFLLALGVLVVADPTRLVKAQDEKKDEKKDKDKDKKDEKKDKDKADKDKDEKKDKDKDEKKDKDKDKKEEKPLTDEQKKELEKFTGTFKIVSFERDGKKSDDAELKKMKVVQKGADWTFYLDTDSTQGKDTPFPDKSPKEIDSLYLNGPARDKVVKGIYKIDGEKITFCWAEPGKDRPKDFATKADSGLTLMTLEKTKEEEKKDKDKDEKKDKDKDKKDKDEKKDKDKDKKDK
jgi:uncharacterized protein (TIGR03067 family)